MADEARDNLGAAARIVREPPMKRILIVEDVALNRDLLTQLLEDEYEILIAVDGADGVDMAIAHRPDLILMDLSLPLVDGWEATRRIKANATTSAIPVMAITANAMSGDEDRARAAGCDDFMTKPVDEDLLFAKLQHWLG
ncbi:response regulator receiver protein [Methylobacterium radiotolerans JCM 2831]|uniref:Response regulator receiver protein n=2 Tax=Methylobacterium radiotolerans TaxID=31998 RepID=B1M7E2_METRJ|nr:response regulator receiver protein [Methylobacterium radiotolerans JCM 2831]GEM95625.1 response regulator [Methylobacterium radiotolerans]